MSPLTNDYPGSYASNALVPESAVSEWQQSVDVLVIGLGAAGACAAWEAAAAGSNVLVLEVGSDYGGTTAMSAGDFYLGGGTRVQQAAGFSDTAEDMANYLMAANAPVADEAKIRQYCNDAVEHFDWLAARGVPFKDTAVTERVVLPLTDDCVIFSGSEKTWPFNEVAKPAPRGHHVQAPGDIGGKMFLDIMAERLKESGVEILLEARALHLIADASGRIVGVVSRVDGQIHCYQARRGVVLCAGGFAMNQEMVERYLPEYGQFATPIGNPNDTGAGIRMAQAAGARAINMQEAFTTVPYYPPATLTFGIFINDKGQRFINEDCYHGRVGYHCMMQSRLSKRIYLVFSVEDYRETESYLGADICATGESIAELEAELELLPGSLQYTLNSYNEEAARGHDPQFHKQPEWLKPLQPPYAALDVTPGRGAYISFFTLGGIDTTVDGEVLDYAGNPIAGLYAAGRTACGIPRTGSGYSSGTSVGDASYSGRRAGKKVAVNQ